MSHNHQEEDKEFVFAFRGQPFATTIPSSNPTPTTLIDFSLVRDLKMKMTDDVVCIQYKTDAAQDMRRMEKFANNLMRHMASKEQN